MEFFSDCQFANGKFTVEKSNYKEQRNFGLNFLTYGSPNFRKKIYLKFLKLSASSTFFLYIKVLQDVANAVLIVIMRSDVLEKLKVSNG